MCFPPSKTISSLEAVVLLPASDVKCDQQRSGVLPVLMHRDLTWKFFSCTGKNREWEKQDLTRMNLHGDMPSHQF